MASPASAAITALPLGSRQLSESELNKDLTTIPFDRPFYEIIVDGIHSHPNSVRVGSYC
jgi:N-acetylglucosamine-6-phosphate deacetylase